MADVKVRIQKPCRHFGFDPPADRLERHQLGRCAGGFECPLEYKNLRSLTRAASGVDIVHLIFCSEVWGVPLVVTAIIICVCKDSMLHLALHVHAWGAPHVFRAVHRFVPKSHVWFILAIFGVSRDDLISPFRWHDAGASYCTECGPGFYASQGEQFHYVYKSGIAASKSPLYLFGVTLHVFYVWFYTNVRLLQQFWLEPIRLAFWCCWISVSQEQRAVQYALLDRLILQ